MTEFDKTREHRQIEVVCYFLVNGRLPETLPDSLRDDPELQDVLNHLGAIQQLALALASGSLEPEVKMKGRVVGALKSLQASLRHLTWQVQQIADGDLTQQVRFMGEFSAAFNRMVDNLRDTRAALDARAEQLEEGRLVATNLMLDAQAARQQTEAAYQTLQAQMEEICALQEQLREQAIRDPLTGCYNRRYLDETLEREISRALRENYPICFVMVDIDHFKQINDRYGHPGGDAVLVALSRLLNSRARAGDMLCRYGGEEFLVVLANIDLAEAATWAEAWRSDIQAHGVEWGGQTIHVTASLGLASFPLHGTQKAHLIGCADQALYEAKRAGRNCIKVYSHTPSQFPGGNTVSGHALDQSG